LALIVSLFAAIKTWFPPTKCKLYSSFGDPADTKKVYCDHW
jgi:hypothetical protein